MKNAPVWLQVVVAILLAGLLAFAAFELFRLASGSVRGAVFISVVMALWVLIYIGRKIAARRT
jgi:hypothetical protein